MAVSSTTGGLRTGVCLSTDRPQNPYNGQVIYETDTNRTLVWDNSVWVVIHDPTLMSYSGTGVTVTADAATIGGENVTPYTGRRNLLYNGAMQVAQRGTSFTGLTSSGSTYGLDRWTLSLDGMGTWSVSQESDGPTGFNKSIKFLCTTAQPSPNANTYLQISQRLEGLDVQQLGYGTSEAKSTTLSFWVKSNLTGTYVCRLYTPDTSRAVHQSITVDSSDTWEYKTVTFPGDTASALGSTNAEALRFTIWLDAGATFTQSSPGTTWGSYSSSTTAYGVAHLAATVNNYIQFTGVQLELGDKATPFEHRSYGEELALCQRYYHDARGHLSFAGMIAADNYFNGMSTSFPTTMRATPSVTVYDLAGTAGQAYYVWGSSGFGTLSISVTSGSVHQFRVYRNFGSAAGSAVTALTSGYIASAEL